MPESASLARRCLGPSYRRNQTAILSFVLLFAHSFIDTTALRAARVEELCSEPYQLFGETVGAFTHREYVELGRLVEAGHLPDRTSRGSEAEIRSCMRDLVAKGKQLGSDAKEFAATGQFPQTALNAVDCQQPDNGQQHSGGSGRPGGGGCQTRRRRSLHGFSPARFREIKNLSHAEIARRSETDDETLRTVVACKLYIRLLFSTEGVGLFFHLNTFIGAGVMGGPNGEFIALTRIHSISGAHSRATDAAILDYTIAEYEAGRKRRNGGVCVIVLVEGLGPAGLLSVWLAFERGFCVVGVNRAAKREDYQRQREVEIDSNGTQLLFWLGGMELVRLTTQKERADDASYPMVRPDRSLELVTPIYRLEVFIHGRLRALQARLEQRAGGRGAATGDGLVLIEGYKLVAIKSPQSTDSPPLRQPLHHLFRGAPPSPAGYQAVAVAVGSKRSNSQPSASWEFFSQGVKSFATHLFNGSPALKFLNFHILIAAGGANDSIRNLYLGVSEPRTRAVYNNVVTLEKGLGLRKHRVSNTSSLVSLLRYIAQNPFFNARHANEILTTGPATECPAVALLEFSAVSAQYPDGFGSRLTEQPNWTLINYCFVDRLQHVEIGGDTVPALEQFYLQMRKEIEAAKRKNGWPNKKVEACMEVLRRITRFWMGTIAHYAVAHIRSLVAIVDPHHLFNIDQHGALLDERRENGLNFLNTDIGTSIFPLEQANLAVPAIYNTHQGSVEVDVVFALGDALASPNFRGGTGLMTARIAVEWAVEALDRHYTGDHFGVEEAKRLVRELNRRLTAIAEQSVRLGEPFRVTIPKDDSATLHKLAKERQCAFINSLADATKSGGQEQNQDWQEFRIGCIPTEMTADGQCVSDAKAEPKFVLRVRQGTNWEELKAKITSNGKIAVNKGGGNHRCTTAESLWQAVNAAVVAG